jgi:membrane protease subunit HflC
MMAEGYRKYYSAAAAAAVLLLAYLTFFPVRETEFVLVTQFGRPVRTITEAGLSAKWPYQTAIYFDRRLRTYNPRPSEFLTRDKKNIVMENYVVWKIADPGRFVQTVGDSTAGEMRLHDIVWAGLAAALGTHDLDSIVGTEPAKVRTSAMLDSLTEITDHAALEQYGINVVDVRIKRLNLPEQNKQSVYARMRAERERIARQYRAEGEEQALSIRADADRQREEILSVAYKEAETIKGQGDAESTRIYGQALFQEPRLLQTGAHAGIV